MYRKIIKIFLASPSDLGDERKLAKEVVQQINADYANFLGYQIDLVGWELTISQRQRAQDAINFDLDQCEHFVGLLGKRWGTPPGPEGHPYSSGFEEEYWRSVARHEKTGKPEISLLFKEWSPEDFDDIGEQRRKVLEFQSKISEEKKQFYQKFDSTSDFERKFRSILSSFLNKKALEEGKIHLVDSQRPRQYESEIKDQQVREVHSLIFETVSSQFLSEFIRKERDGENACSAAEVARFRLLACSVSQSGNDIVELGTHDANIIYRDLKAVTFSRQELSRLVSTALENLDSFTVPLWHWIFQHDYKLKRELPIFTFWGSEKRRRNAFRLMEMLSIAPQDFELGSNKIDVAKIWFSSSQTEELVVAALEYLGAVGDDGLQIDWAKFIGSSEANISRAAVRSCARIKMRENRVKALQFAAEHEGVDLGSELVDDLIVNIKSIETEILRSCLVNKTGKLRAALARELFERAALVMPDVQLICESAEADIRLIGAKAMAKLNPEMTLQDAERIFIKSQKQSPSILPALRSDRDFPGEEAFKEYKIDLLSNKSYKDLLEAQKYESIYSTEVTCALYRGHFKKSKSDIERHLVNGFEEFYATRQLAIQGQVGAPSDDLCKFLQEKMTQSCLEIFCANADRSDLNMVRKVLDRGNFYFSNEIVDYFAKFGEWQDAVRLIKLSRRMRHGLGLSSLLILDYFRDYKNLSRAIIKLGAKRIPDLWKLELPTQARVQLLALLPKKLFMAFDDPSLINMLLWDDDPVREVVALKIILCLPKSRIRRLLDLYVKSEVGYYYNVIFWLDLSLSTDQGMARAIATRRISSK